MSFAHGEPMLPVLGISIPPERAPAPPEPLRKHSSARSSSDYLGAGHKLGGQRPKFASAPGRMRQQSLAESPSNPFVAAPAATVWPPGIELATVGPETGRGPRRFAGADGGGGLL